jgi:hypothetical protein
MCRKRSKQCSARFPDRDRKLDRLTGGRVRQFICTRKDEGIDEGENAVDANYRIDCGGQFVDTLVFDVIAFGGSIPLAGLANLFAFSYSYQSAVGSCGDSARPTPSSTSEALRGHRHLRLQDRLQPISRRLEVSATSCRPAAACVERSRGVLVLLRCVLPLEWKNVCTTITSVVNLKGYLTGPGYVSSTKNAV